jgi:2-keto-4-pentenoate hydratase/2-oxohepta-3-ene-1,7-dioic acid hydratase in catechol pathway
MKLVVYTRAGVSGLVGVLENDRVTDVTEWIGGDLLSLLKKGDEGISQLQASIAKESSQSFSVDSVTIEAPVVPHVRIFGIGLNYEEHAAESKMQPQKVPTVFLKLASSVVGPGHDIKLPSISTQPDYEAELAVVIGKGGHRIAAADWEQHVAGYTIVNDVSARDVQLATSQWTLGKSFPTFTPLGPAIVTADEIADPHALGISLAIDGETLQDSNTRDLIFRIPQLIEYISSLAPLEAGDIISTGTPEGVGLGRTPQRWLKPGEEMVITIEGLGQLRNRTVAETK